MEKHEFYLKHYPTLDETERVYRIALGKLINSEERKTFEPGWKSPEFGNKTGSIGYLDVEFGDKFIPVDCSKGTDYSNMEHRDVLTILVVGIEPEYQKQGYGTQLINRAEEIASERRLDTLIVSWLEDEISRKLFTRLGYQLYEDGFYATKRLYF